MTNLDEEDLIILRDLQEDGRVSNADPSRKTGIPASTIHTCACETFIGDLRQ